MRILYITFLALFLSVSCREAEVKEAAEGNSLINTAHLDSLYEDINAGGVHMGIIHIYSDYPDYKWIGDEDEGVACVDDAARAAIFYLKNYKAAGDSNSLKKAKSLLGFLLHMQSDNGYFYNFIFKDHSINNTHRNSVAEPGWWSWRAMWALSEGYKELSRINPELCGRIKAALDKAILTLRKSFPKEKRINIIDGISYPTWLPAETASDQAAVLILALLNYPGITKDIEMNKYLNDLCDGILLMQKGDKSEVPFGAFLSWRNLWHAYGNSQSYALLKASEILRRDDLKKAALKEINYFYEYLLAGNFLSSFEIISAPGEDSLKFSDENKYPQIAYNFRPMIFACLEAFSITQDSAYIKKAIKISGWFFGLNPADTQMYDPATGICFDGINSEKDVNLNSGAESTIEALLCLQALEHEGVQKKDLLKYISKKKQ